MTTARTLSSRHLADLLKSGITREQALAAGLYTETDPAAVARLLGWDKPANGLGPCLVIPFPESGGYARVKPDRPRRLGGRVVKYESPRNTPNRVYMPPVVRAKLADTNVTLFITEGEKKALGGAVRGLTCVGLVGTEAWSAPRGKKAGKPAGPRVLCGDLAAVPMAGRRVRVVFDSDAATNPNVLWAEWGLVEALLAAGADVRVVRLPAAADGSKQGLDDFIAGRPPADFKALVHAAGTPVRPSIPRPARPDRDDDAALVEVLVGPDEGRVNDEAVAALANKPDLYQMGGWLMTVVAVGESDPNQLVRRTAGSPVVRPVHRDQMSELLSRVVRFVQPKQLGDGEVANVRCQAPAWCSRAVRVRGDWPGVRRLEALVTFPVLLPDGRVLGTPGFDPATGLLYVPDEAALIVPDRPTLADARRAVAELLEVVCDFPFAGPEHRAAWLAGVLTPLAWWAFDGPAPLFLSDGNAPGAGKGKLMHAAGTIITGRKFPVMTFDADPEEFKKAVTTLALAGDRMVLLDNLEGEIGHAQLNAVLTAERRWKARLLGENRDYDGPLNVVWYATGNNVEMVGDSARRVIQVRLETSHERPEERDDFKHPNLIAYIEVNRPRLLAAALTILRAWHVADRPTVKLPAWGSFEGWSGVVRQAVVWAGQPDPGEARLVRAAGGDTTAEAMRALVAGWRLLDPDQQGVSCGAVLQAMGAPENGERLADFRAAVAEVAGTGRDQSEVAKRLGRKLGGARRRNFGGFMFERAGVTAGSARWKVVRVTVPLVPP